MERLLRTLAFGLLALALLCKPMLAELCNAHALAHMVAKRAAMGEGPHHVDTALEARSDSDHASGKHQTLHASDASPAYVEPFPALTVPPARFTVLALPSYVAGVPPAQRPDSLFRPPIGC